MASRKNNYWNDNEITASSDLLAAHLKGEPNNINLLRYNAAGAGVLTIQPQNIIELPSAIKLTLLQTGSGAITITAGAGVTINNPLNLQTTNAGDKLNLFQLAENVWYVTN